MSLSTEHSRVIPRAQIVEFIESLGFDPHQVKWMDLHPMTLIVHLAVPTGEPMPPPEELDPIVPNALVTRRVFVDIRDA